jgi:hypothetical protein
LWLEFDIELGLDLDVFKGFVEYEVIGLSVAIEGIEASVFCRGTVDEKQGRKSEDFTETSVAIFTNFSDLPRFDDLH